MGILGVIFGTVMGSYMSYYVEKISKVITGYHYIYTYPLAFVLNVATVSIIIALIAGLYPARRAARMNIVNAIDYE